MLKHQISTGKESVSDTIANTDSPHTFDREIFIYRNIFAQKTNQIRNILIITAADEMLIIADKDGGHVILHSLGVTSEEYNILASSTMPVAVTYDPVEQQVNTGPFTPSESETFL